MAVLTFFRIIERKWKTKTFFFSAEPEIGHGIGPNFTANVRFFGKNLTQTKQFNLRATDFGNLGFFFRSSLAALDF